MDRAIIAGILSASADKKIVGRIRIQKIVYLLEQMGLNSGLKFSYHHYGPYSEQLSQSLMVAEMVDGIVKEDFDTSASGNQFSIYRLVNDELTSMPNGCEIAFEDVCEAVKHMQRPTSVVIELAATIHWLKCKESVGDWLSELKARKAGKATEENIEKAQALLEKLGL